ncbi:tRNA (adenosine(37)-N6)-threonylcarbamoyltransferase complex ATPase subunit type 1 TsaE [Candidatus Parcubacteria bacterium]|nr:tRNA (adenosine(37)-N6)-threonylcarbamoyltransferase complex ATPase subunit type 1 TsaE [Candidatus Parcubacteria bacterium]
MKYLCQSTEETRELAKHLVSELRSKDHAQVVALTGDLGGGKTTFSQFVGEALGVHDAIQSPTFLIEKIYELHRAPWKHLVHIDAYRLDEDYELLNLGWENIVSKPENIILVEWADKVKNILPPDTIHIQCTFIDENSRQFEISENNEKA